MAKKPKENQKLDPKFEATVKRMLKTPPKPHKPKSREQDKD